MSKIKDKRDFFAILFQGILSAIRNGNFIMYTEQVVSEGEMHDEIMIVTNAFGRLHPESLEAISDKLSGRLLSESALSEARDILKQHN
jgi:hypothetical protein